MGCIGPQEGLVIIGIIVLLMGVNRLPQLGAAVGRSLISFRRAIAGKDEVDVTPQVEPGETAEDPSKSA